MHLVASTPSMRLGAVRMLFAPVVRVADDSDIEQKGGIGLLCAVRGPPLAQAAALNSLAYVRSVGRAGMPL